MAGHCDRLVDGVRRHLERELEPRCPGELADQMVEHRKAARDVTAPSPSSTRTLTFIRSVSGELTG